MYLPYATLPHLQRTRSCGHQLSNCNHSPCTFSPPEWVTLEDFEPVSQGYDGGNVMVIEAPTSFSPFSPVKCTLLSHFSFNDFIAIAFPDLARDLDIQI